MNQERFDELAKGLATNQLSRRQVIKSFVAGVLLAGPLGAIWAKPASAARCPTCGTCTEVSINTASNTVKRAKCTGAIECTAKSLCQMANQSARYRKLERYLINKGFKAAAAPQAMVLREDGRLVRKIFGTSYTNSARGQNATFTYAKEASGQTKAWAIVAEGNVVKYALAFDRNGQIIKGLAPKGRPQTAAPASGAARTFSSAPQTTSTSDAPVVEYAATGFDTQQCKLECAVGCGIVGTVACTIANALICAPTTIASPAVLAACAWSFRITCGLVAGTECRKYCNKECQCPYGKPPCGNTCLQPCQDCLNHEVVEKKCGTSACATCEPTTNRCEERASKLCNGVCCPEGETCCNGSCTNTNWDEDNCGSCGNTCKSGQTCKQGKCENRKCGGSGGVSCPPDQPDCCNDQCVNTSSDPSNCGACGNRCKPGQTCKQGKCVKKTKCGGSGGVKCSPGQDCCNGQCVNTQTDPKNCGACGKKCATGQACKQGKCVNTKCGGNGGVACPPDRPTCCDGTCVNLATGMGRPDGSTIHCGSCGGYCGPGSSCGLSHPGVTCGPRVNGVCDPGMCCGCGVGCNCVPPS